jgi:hypothetical protein
MQIDHVFHRLDLLFNRLRKRRGVVKELTAAGVTVAVEFTSDGATWIELIDERVGNGGWSHLISRSYADDPPWARAATTEQ